MAATGAATPSEYLTRLDDRPGEIEDLVESLRIGHSEFFRDPLAFALVEHLILPGLDLERARAGRSELRIWSAGCADAPKAYSIAILLDAVRRDREKVTPGSDDHRRSPRSRRDHRRGTRVCPIAMSRWSPRCS